jgi:hypothetical protein
MKVFVTGAAGFIGPHVAGCPFVGWYRNEHIG